MPRRIRKPTKARLARPRLRGAACRHPRRSWVETNSAPRGPSGRRQMRLAAMPAAELTGADGPLSEGGRRILLDNSRVYVRFLPFVGGRVHLIRISAHQATLDDPLGPPETEISRPRVSTKSRSEPNPRVSATPPSRWTITPLFYSQSTDLPVLRGRRYVDGGWERPQTGVL